MINISANANINLKEVPHTLYVHGSIMTYRADDKIEITKAEVQGINPTILVLELKLINGSGPMKGTPKHFNYNTSVEDANTYSQVTIRYADRAALTINIEIFG
jgi:hypothetical protein